MVFFKIIISCVRKISVIWKSDLTDKMKRSFFPSSGRVDTAVWMHDMDTNEADGEEARWQLHKNVASNIKQVLEATLHKAAAVRPPTSHHENYLL